MLLQSIKHRSVLQNRKYSLGKFGFLVFFKDLINLMKLIIQLIDAVLAGVCPVDAACDLFYCAVNTIKP